MSSLLTLGGQKADKSKKTKWVMFFYTPSIIIIVQTNCQTTDKWANFLRMKFFCR